MDLFTINDDEINVVDIMKKIRENIQRKREQGIYTDEEVEEMSRLKLETFADEAEIDAQLLNKLLSPSHAWNISTDYRIKTHRKGIKGRLIVLAKKLVRPLVRLYTDQPVSRQAQLNQYFVHLLHNTIREMTRLQIRTTTLKNRIDLLEREKDMLQRREKTLEKMVQFKEREDESPEEPKKQ